MSKCSVQKKEFDKSHREKGNYYRKVQEKLFLKKKNILKKRIFRPRIFSKDSFTKHTYTIYVIYRAYMAFVSKDYVTTFYVDIVCSMVSIYIENR